MPAPGLREVAEVWWDVARDPEVVWDVDARRFDLADPRDAGRRLALAVLATPAEDATALATVLAEGLAACDFPPTGEGASPVRVEQALRAAGVTARLAG